MKEPELGVAPQEAISASWERCEQQHKLKRNTARPVLRLQSSEVGARLEELVELTGGRQGVFRQLAGLAAEAGNCLVITDADGILVRLESKDMAPEWNGIALGSIWDERIAGTNGVSMALSEGREFTVRGKDHFFSQLQPFSCTAVPLRDAKNGIIGAVNLSAIERNRPGEYLFSQQLLNAAADKIQRILFEKEFQDSKIISLSDPSNRNLLRAADLVAIDGAGKILGSTSMAHKLAGVSSPEELTALAFSDAFGVDPAAVDRVPGRVLSIRREQGSPLDLWARNKQGLKKIVPGWKPKPAPSRIRRRLPPSLRDLALGSGAMTAICEKAEDCLAHGLPMLIQGETGTGKSALVAALLGGSYRALTVDCALLEDSEDDRAYVSSLIEQLRALDALNFEADMQSALVLENVDELPAYAQSALRNLLDDFERRSDRTNNALQVTSTCRGSLKASLDQGHFRDDLFYMLSGIPLVLPPLRERNKRLDLVQSLANVLAGQDVELSAEAKGAILAYHWPGNVRELRNVLQRALVCGNGSIITSVDLGLTDASFDLPSPAKPRDIDEKSIVLDALNSAQWNVSKAARSMGIGRATLHRKMKMHGISRPT